MNQDVIIAALNAADPTHEPCPFTITFPSVEVALAELGQKVFGATIVIAERPAPPPTPPAPAEPHYRLLEDGEKILPTDQWLNDGFGGPGEWEQRQSVMPGEILNLVTAGGDHTPHRRLVTTPTPTPAHHGTEAEAIEAEAQRLHACWHEAATEVTTLRDEVKRLADLVEQGQARFEREQMCHGACGVIAMADTRESATNARDGMHPDYRSVSVNAVARRVDECIKLRDEVKRLADMLDKCRSGNHTRDALNKALNEKLDNWMKTAELRLGTVCCLQEEKENLVAERDALAEWKREALTVISKWDEVDAYVRKHPDAVIGDFISDTVLKLQPAQTRKANR